jgi:UPF0755 protein
MKKWLLLLPVMLVAATGIAGWRFYQAAQLELNTPMPIPADTVLRVETGMTLAQVAGQLEADGWLLHPHWLVWEARRQKRAHLIRAGEYAIAPDTTPLQLLDVLIEGKVVQHALTLIEGWTVVEILQAVRGSPHLRQTLSSQGGAAVMAAIGRAGHFPEGRFLPDTYHFPSGTTDVDFLSRAYQAMETLLAQEWQRRKPGLPYRSPYQALILASLVEKETAVPSERSRIAGVFVRRLQKGMLLQTDPTVIYALGSAYDGNIRRDDLQIDSPYNTYMYTGLPPTPIAAPGRDAIVAALQPEDGEELYFVARQDGSHEFSATLAEHNAAVRKYQLGGR